MKKIILVAAFLITIFTLRAQDGENIDSIYQSALTAYEGQDFQKSAKCFSKVIQLAKGIENLSDYSLFNGACIFSKNKDRERSFEILTFLANERLFSKLDKINNEKDFEALHNTEQWQKSINKISTNQKTYPFRNRKEIKSKLLEAKKLLKKDNGKLWGHQIWNDSIIIIDYDNTIYSLVALKGSKTDDDTLYYKVIDTPVLAFVNTTQKYEGDEYATVLRNYLNDKSATIIHELFHLLQFKFRKFNGEAIDYLDETDARILLRLEYQALKNALSAIIDKKDVESVKKKLKDAIIFRKERQNKHREYLQREIEIETLEGLANYTGFVLSTYENKYQKAMSEIDEREQAETYTRPFPYATGVAYGLIFDYLNIEWKVGLNKVYNFADIYEDKVLQSKLKENKAVIKQAKERNNFDEIYSQEKKREEKQNKLIAYYTDLLVEKPTLKVAIKNFDKYSRSYNMNGTLTLKNIGTVYSSIKGRDKSGGKNFGDFSTIKGKDRLGISGVLFCEENGVYYFVFPLPLEIKGSKIVGKFYEIELNPHWKVKKYKDRNMEIVEK